jgi:hypothetical protein
MSLSGLVKVLKKSAASVTVAVLAILSVCDLAVAHPGHGDPTVTNPAVHYLTDPFHIGQWLVLFLVVGITLRHVRKTQLSQYQRPIDRTIEN